MSSQDKELIITKTDAAIRQLSEAINLFFDERDPIAIHTLASAAGQLAADIAKHRNLKCPFRRPDFLDKNSQKSWIKSIKSAENFFKHADKDPDATYIYPTNVTAIFLGEAVTTIENITPKISIEIEVFQMWFIQKYGIHYPAVANSNDYKRFKIEGTNLDDLKFFKCLIEIRKMDAVAS